MSQKAWPAVAVATALTAGAWLYSPQLGGLAVIALALGAVAVFAYRML